MKHCWGCAENELSHKPSETGKQAEPKKQIEKQAMLWQI
jgi:hypothetical protein